jgi:hypothetical protein
MVQNVGEMEQKGIWRCRRKRDHFGTASHDNTMNSTVCVLCIAAADKVCAQKGCCSIYFMSCRGSRAEMPFVASVLRQLKQYNN